MTPKKRGDEVKKVKAWAIVVDGHFAKSHLSPYLSFYQIFDDEPQEFISREARVIEVEIRPLKKAGKNG
jgi:hypothetical protein